MQELFVSYEQAQKLRSLGFDEECLARYCVITEWEKPTGEIKLQLFSDATTKDRFLVKAPLYQQVFDWFREKGLHSWIYQSNRYRFHYTILKDGRYVKDDSDAIHYQEARQACLEKLIQIVEDEKSN